jgi:hypothetical protein
MIVLGHNSAGRLAVPMPGCATTATHVAHFFQANFEMHL